MDPLERWEGCQLQAVVADQAAYHGPILLLNVAGVVLPVRPRAREGDALAGAVVEHDVVDELGAVVAVQPEDPKREIGLSRCNA
jgi:hypothetical protein